MKFLGISINEDKLKKSIDQQSFENAKKRFSDNEEDSKARFLRTGRSGQWRKY